MRSGTRRHRPWGTCSTPPSMKRWFSSQSVTIDAQDLEHRVREVGVPAAGAEADLAEHLAVAEGELRNAFEEATKS